MKKYKLTTCTGIEKESSLNDIIELLSTDKITELTNNDICFLSAGMDIEKKDKNNKFMYKVELVVH